MAAVGAITPTSFEGDPQVVVRVEKETQHGIVLEYVAAVDRPKSLPIAVESRNAPEYCPYDDDGSVVRDRRTVHMVGLQPAVCSRGKRPETIPVEEKKPVGIGDE